MFTLCYLLSGYKLCVDGIHNSWGKLNLMLQIVYDGICCILVSCLLRRFYLFMVY